MNIKKLVIASAFALTAGYGSGALANDGTDYTLTVFPNAHAYCDGVDFPKDLPDVKLSFGTTTAAGKATGYDPKGTGVTITGAGGAKIEGNTVFFDHSNQGNCNSQIASGITLTIPNGKYLAIQIGEDLAPGTVGTTFGGGTLIAKHNTAAGFQASGTQFYFCGASGNNAASWAQICND